MAGALEMHAEYERALLVYESALDRYSQTLGVEHEHYLSTRHNMAICHKKMGDEHVSVARAIFDELIPTELRLLGPEHQLTLRSQSNYGNFIFNDFISNISIYF